MNDEFRALRVFLVPLVLIVLFFVITPRMCARAVNRTKEQPKETTQTATALEPSGGLQIAGSPARPAEAKASTFPEGLDAARIQYLVEIDPQFSAPSLATLPKTFTATDEVTRVLVNKQYIEKGSDGKTSITREGALNLTLTEQPDSWTFPIGKRTFDKVTFVSRVEDDKYDGTFTWHWEPTPVGNDLHLDGKKGYSATAQFAGGEHHWALTKWISAPTG